MPIIVHISKMNAEAASCSLPGRLQRLGLMSTATANIACVGDVTVAKRSVHKSGEASGRMF